MKVMSLAAAGALALGLAACSGGSDCTPEALSKKTEELSKAIQQKLTSDPAKGAELMKKMGELAGKIQAAAGNQAEACKAVDDLLKSVKG